MTDEKRLADEITKLQPDWAYNEECDVDAQMVGDALAKAGFRLEPLDPEKHKAELARIKARKEKERRERKKARAKAAKEKAEFPLGQRKDFPMFNPFAEDAYRLPRAYR